MTISISDLSPVTSESLLASIDPEAGGAIKSAVARAIASRKVMGGLTKSTSLTKTDIQIDPVEPVIDSEVKEPVTVGKIAYPPITVGLIAYPPCPPPITVGLIAYDPAPTLETF
ncbi:hypothetical protein [Calothrix sp. NIES-2098]|uniref:hypothetical protein n=1 Tax=Calothrix sp. NIES-2098 TaxID=1954171 RepID=UPI000B611DA3|nr:hypothetical protein NIES2098_06780 [Calothrix sp. NIES-2098]